MTIQWYIYLVKIFLYFSERKVVLDWPKLGQGNHTSSFNTSEYCIQAFMPHMKSCEFRVKFTGKFSQENRVRKVLTWYTCDVNSCEIDMKKFTRISLHTNFMLNSREFYIIGCVLLSILSTSISSEYSHSQTRDAIFNTYIKDLRNVLLDTKDLGMLY